ncbi:MAG: peptidylprolyl isomerase [Marinovum sp.]|nr:peptidylprolyl isomerase [Marinovum sp.]
MIKPLLMSCSIIFALFFSASFANAENLFSTAIKVNDRSITVYELRQRSLFLKLLNVPGDPDLIAKEQLIDDRLKLSAAKTIGVELTEAEIKLGMEEFAARGKLDLPNFVKQLKALGISETTLRDFVKSGLLWRAVVQTKFGAQSQVPDAQLERSTNIEGSGGGIRVLLSEIILQVLPGQEQKAQDLADELSKITSTKAFSDAARRYSVAPTSASGGHIKWQALEKLPAVVQPLIFGLAPGDVTDPLPIPNGLALFQLRAVEETGVDRANKAIIDYLTYKFPAGDSAMQMKLQVGIKHCDDLYALATDHPNHVFNRNSSALVKIKSDIRSVVARLDRQEKEFLSIADQTLMVMVCGRNTLAQNSATDLEKIRFGLRNKRLAGYAEGYLENLRQDARIIEK